MKLEDEAFIFRLDESEASGNTAKDCAHTSCHNLTESLDEREFLLFQHGVF